MSATKDFAAMLKALETLFSDENLPGGTEAANALSKAAEEPFELPPPHSPDMVSDAESILRGGNHMAAAAILAALPLIDWHHSGLKDGRIRPEIALSMATSELIGPDGMIFHPTVRVGLFMQNANIDYVTRTHPAEETFVMLGGAGYWSCNGSAPQRRVAGAYIHHPAHALHASVTSNRPLFAAWRWTGDIGFDGYALIG